MVRLTVPIANLRFHRSADILNDGERFVSISEMSQEEFVSSVDDVVVAQILYIKKKKDESVFTRSRGTSEKNLSFERLLMCRCLNSPSGLNCFAVLLGVNKNARFFHRNLEGRDTGLFSPGCLIAIDNPPVVDSWLGSGESGIPLLETPHGVYTVDTIASPVQLPNVPVSLNASKLQGYHYGSVKLVMESFYFIDTKCTGRCCDAIDVYHEGTVAKQCACFSIISRLSQVVLMISFRTVQFSEPYTALFPVTNFTSRRFTNLFITEGSIPCGVTASMITSDRRFYRSAMRNAQNLIDRVNDRCGWSVSGWTRRGFIRDINSSSSAGAADAGTANQVVSSTLLHHGVSVTPNDLEVDIDEFKTSFANFGAGVIG